LHLKHIATGGDPFELGSARPLDFGHWVAHKLEQITEFAVGHGEAVAIGMAVDLIYARHKEMLDTDSLDRILRLISFLGFSLWHDALLHRDESGQLLILRGLEEFREHLGGDLCVTLVTEIGTGVEVGEIDPTAVEKALHELSIRTAPDTNTPA
jgi:3-dehydroquinate synthase